MEKDTIKKINKVLEKLRPFLESDGGDVEFIKYENNIVYLTLTGACRDCGLIDDTLHNGIEEFLKEEIPEIKGVVNVIDGVDFDD